MSKANKAQETPAAATTEGEAVQTSSPSPQKKKVAICAVHADMVHLLTGERITLQGVNIELDSWVQMQIDAGKLRRDN